MSPSNKTKQSKTKAAKCAQPLANTSALERNNHTDSPSNNTLSSASATRTEFCNFINSPTCKPSNISLPSPLRRQKEKTSHFYGRRLSRKVSSLDTHYMEGWRRS